jgi:hypothetical protein
MRDSGAASISESGKSGSVAALMFFEGHHLPSGNGGKSFVNVRLGP